MSPGTSTSTAAAGRGTLEHGPADGSEPQPLRILVVGGHTERRHEVAGAVESLGQQVILEEHLVRVGAEAVLTSHRLLPRSGEAEDPADVRDHPSTS